MALLNSHYAYGLDHKHKSIIDELRYENAMTGVQRELVEKFIMQIDAYLKASDQVLTMIYLNLAKPFIDQMDILFEDQISK